MTASPSPMRFSLAVALAMPVWSKGAWARLKPGGRLVANAVTAEGEGHLFALHGKLGGDMTRLSVARLAPVGDLHGWKPLMPVTQYWVDKK